MKRQNILKGFFKPEEKPFYFSCFSWFYIPAFIRPSTLTHDIVTLSHLLGHSSISMTMVYAHVLEDDREVGIHAFDDML